MNDEAPLEIERRFLVDDLPTTLPEPDRIQQGYLMTEPASVRVRRTNTGHTLTVKVAAGGSGRDRIEVERSISEHEFNALWDVATELRVHKDRYLVPLFSRHEIAELDLFKGDLDGKRLVEVEFASGDEADEFDPPEWFGREVTDDGRYTNASLARHGWPADDSTPSHPIG